MAGSETGRARSLAVVVDWGTTSFRAFLAEGDGSVRSAIETAEGIAGLCPDDFEPVLMRNLQPWFEAHRQLPVICLGMITSRSGWMEVPYVSCPAGARELARGAKRTVLAHGGPLVFLAGLSDKGRRPFPDVMRGEETQIVGFGLEQPATLVLPGTHSKWARIEKGRIEGFQTFVTGEIFTLLTQHSFIARAAGKPPAIPDWGAFERGVRFAAGESAEAASFLSALFSARTGMLAGELDAKEINDYVSGLVIGREFYEARAQGWFGRGGRIGIVGNDGLNVRYARAAKSFGLEVVDGGEEAAIRGALTILEAMDDAATNA